MLWIGPELSALERACMRSVMAQGHRLTLYTYDPVGSVPEGVDRRDAAEILPRSAIIHHKRGSVALFSDYFRFELQRRGLGLWLDADTYLLAPLDYAPGAHVFGWNEADCLGAGVLQLPAGSPIVAEVIDLFERPHVPGWLRWQDRLRSHARAVLAGGVRLGDLPWGVAGPLALTALARKHGVIDQAQDRRIFYPFDYAESGWIFDPARSLEEWITPQTRAIHLYNHMIASRKAEPAAPGSFMARLQAEGA